MRYLLDTNVFIFYAQGGESLDKDTTAIFGDYENLIYVSAEVVKETIAAYAVIFLPLLSIVIEYSHGSWRMAMDNVLIPAFISTLTVFAALTATVFATKTDFSFLRTFVIFGTFFALGAIIIFSISGMHTGSWFAIAMIILMSATILYQTDQIKTKFDTSQHVGAGAMIFASFMVLLWYVIRLFVSKGRD
jgi:FtsH-binding integral membrane protein